MSQQQRPMLHLWDTVQIPKNQQGYVDEKTAETVGKEILADTFNWNQVDVFFQAVHNMQSQTLMSCSEHILKSNQSPPQLKQILNSTTTSIFMQKLLSDELKDADALLAIYDEYRYDGYDTRTTMFQLFKKFTPNGVLRLAMLIALRGVKVANFSNVVIDQKTIDQHLKEGTIVARAGRPEDLTLQRIATVSAPLTARALQQVDSKRPVPKRYGNVPIPGWLQFPTAITLPWNSTFAPAARYMAIEFSRSFNGDINLQLVNQIMQNPVPIPVGQGWDDLRTSRCFTVNAVQLTPEETTLMNQIGAVLLSIDKVLNGGSLLAVNYVTNEDEKAKLLIKMTSKKQA